MKKMIKSTSNFEGIEQYGEDEAKDEREDEAKDERGDEYDSDNSVSDSSDSDSSDSDSDNSDDSENDELFLEREIFETINFDPDLLMKILEANAHMGVSSEEFLQRFRKYQAENPVTFERKEIKRKGLADIDEEKLNEARKSSRKTYETGKECENEPSDSEASIESDSEPSNDYESDDNYEVGDEFIYGPTLDQLKRSSQIQTEITDEKEAAIENEKSPNISDYYDAMDRELQSELKHYNPDLDETSNLGKNVIESMMAGRGGANPMETVIYSLGKKIPRE